MTIRLARRRRGPFVVGAWPADRRDQGQTARWLPRKASATCRPCRHRPLPFPKHRPQMERQLQSRPECGAELGASCAEHKADPCRERRTESSGRQRVEPARWRPFWAPRPPKWRWRPPECHLPETSPQSVRRGAVPLRAAAPDDRVAPGRPGRYRPRAARPREIGWYKIPPSSSNRSFARKQRREKWDRNGKCDWPRSLPPRSVQPHRARARPAA